MHTPVGVENNSSLKDWDDKYLVPKKEQINFPNFEDLFNLILNSLGCSQVQALCLLRTPTYLIWVSIRNGFCVDLLLQ